MYNTGCTTVHKNTAYLENHFINSFIRSTGPIAMARRRSVGPSGNTCNSATNVRIFFKIGGNIPWANITKPFFRFCKIFHFEFKINKFQF